MAVADQAASGPNTGDAGEASKMGLLDQAITAALDGAGKEGDVPKGEKLGDDIADEFTNPDMLDKIEKSRKGKGNDDAGDKRDGEDAAAAQDGSGDKENEAVGDDKAKAFVAPKHWPDADKQAFAKLPKEGQEIALKIAKNLEGGFTRKSQELADEVKYAKSVRSLWSDADRAQLQQAGIDEVGAVRYLVGLQRAATENPPGYIRWAMQTLGVRPEHLFPQMSPAAGQQANPADPQQQQQTAQGSGDPKLDELLADPNVKRLETKLGQTEQLLAEVVGRMTQRERAEWEYMQRQEQQRKADEHRQTQQLQSVVDQFRYAQDDNGLTLYPHFDAVAQQMGAIMDTDPRLKKMQDGIDKMAAAYRKVVGGDEELSAPIFEAEVSKRMAAAEKKREADRAKRVTAVRPASGAPTQRAKNSSNPLDDAILGAFAKSGF